MSGPDKNTYADKPLDASGSGQQRMVSADARRNQGQVGAYTTESGTPLAFSGDDEALFVKVIRDVNGPVAVSDIPQDAIDGNGTGVLICALCPASLRELWVTDARDTSQETPDPRWLMMFDATVAPTAGDIPAYAPIRICTNSTTSVDEIDEPLGFVNGIVLALSTTSQNYTAITPAADYSITARVLGD